MKKASSDSSVNIKLRQDFYRDGWRVMILSLPVLIICLIVSISLNFWQAMHRPEPRYFATNNGALIELPPMDKPFQTEAELLQWASKSVCRAYQYDFENYRNQFEQLREIFTDIGFESYKNSVKTTRIPLIIANKFVSSAVLTASPVITGRSVVNGVLMFKIDVPVKITLINRSESLSGDYVISTIVSRVPYTQSVYGVKIAQINEIRS